MSEQDNIPQQPGFPEAESGSVRPAEAAEPARPASAAKPMSAWEAAAFEPQDSVQRPASPYGAVSGQPAPPAGAPQQPASPYATAQPASPYDAPPQPASPYGAVPQQPGVAEQGAQQSYGAPSVQSGVRPYAAPSSGKATGALVCGILAIVFSSMPIVGIVLGIVAVVLASKAVKEFGKNGKATGGKVCGFIGIGLSVIVAVIVAVSLVVFGSFGDNDPTVTNNTLSLSKGGSSPLASNATEKHSDAEAAAQAAVEAKLKMLVNPDDAFIKEIAKLADDGFYEQTEMHLSDIGVNPEDYARWITEGITYEIESVSIAESSGTGTVCANIKTRDVFAFLEDFSNGLSEYENSEAYANAASESEVKDTFGKMFQFSMDATAKEYTTDYAVLSVEKKGGSWQVEQDSWDFEIDYLFGLV